MNPNKPVSEMSQAVAVLRPFFRRATGFSLISSLLVLTSSWYMLEVYDRVVNSRNVNTLIMLTLITLVLLAVMEVLEWARAQVMRTAGMVFDERLSERLFNAIFASAVLKGPGGTIQPMNDLRTLREVLPSPVMFALMEAPTSLVFLLLIFAVNPLLGWTATVTAIVQIGVGWLNERSTQPPLLQANRSAIAAQQYADGTLRNAQVIESMGMMQDIQRRWLLKQREFLSLQALASDKGGAFQALTKFLQTTVSSALLGLSAWLLLHNQLAGGSAMLVISGILGGRVLTPLVTLVSQWRQVVNVRDAWSRIDALLMAMPVKPPSMPLPAPRGLLQVENVVAAAPGSQMTILRGVSFVLPPGQVLAVVGPSASGKTTLARLLAGLWPAASGKVRLDGVDVYSWDKGELGPYIGYLPQDVELFDGSVAENIARFSEPDQGKVEAAARAVGLHDFIMSLPQGYDSPLGRDGALLSGGQRQRVGLARAIYGDPVFVILDEPNSSLDEAGDAALAQAITLLKSRGTTFVVMTHRTSVLAVVDAMLVLRDGQVQLGGPRDEVLAALQKANAQAQGQPQGQAQAKPQLENAGAIEQPAKTSEEGRK